MQKFALCDPTPVKIKGEMGERSESIFRATPMDPTTDQLLTGRQSIVWEMRGLDDKSSAVKHTPDYRRVV